VRYEKRTRGARHQAENARQHDAREPAGRSRFRFLLHGGPTEQRRSGCLRRNVEAAERALGRGRGPPRQSEPQVGEIWISLAPDFQTGRDSVVPRERAIRGHSRPATAARNAPVGDACDRPDVRVEVWVGVIRRRGRTVPVPSVNGQGSDTPFRHVGVVGQRTIESSGTVDARVIALPFLEPPAARETAKRAYSSVRRVRRPVREHHPRNSRRNQKSHRLHALHLLTPPGAPHLHDVCRIERPSQADAIGNRSAELRAQSGARRQKVE